MGFACGSTHPTGELGRVDGGVSITMWKRITLYGLLLALGTLALQWLDYQRMARLHMRGVYDFLLAAGFLALGLWNGARGWGGGGGEGACEGKERADRKRGGWGKRGCEWGEMGGGGVRKKK